MDAPRLGHLIELPLALRYPLAAWFGLDRRSVWALSDGLAGCPDCQSLKVIFQITREQGQVRARCIGCASEQPHDSVAFRAS